MHHWGLKFGSYIAYIASKPKTHNARKWHCELWFWGYICNTSSCAWIHHRNTNCWTLQACTHNNWAATCAFQQYGILTSVHSDEPVQPPFMLRNFKWCSVSSLNSHRIFKRLANALIRLRVCAGWYEALLVAHTTSLEISCCGSSCMHTHMHLHASHVLEVRSLYYIYSIKTKSSQCQKMALWIFGFEAIDICNIRTELQTPLHAYTTETLTAEPYTVHCTKYSWNQAPPFVGREELRWRHTSIFFDWQVLWRVWLKDTSHSPL